MSKCIVLIFFVYLACAMAKFYKELTNKKFTSNAEYHAKTNLFQRDNYCKETHGCKVFNYNMKLQICQLTNRDTNHNYDDAVLSGGWEAYIQIMDQVIIYSGYYGKKSNYYLHRVLYNSLRID